MEKNLRLAEEIGKLRENVRILNRIKDRETWTQLELIEILRDK